MTATTALLVLVLTVTAASGLKEICQWETFEAKCQDDEVIMITEAHYGRMGIGRCQPRDFGFAGCSADVTDIMHTRCSGKKYCSVNVPDAAMFAASPCPKDLVSYLQADYKCVKVAKSNVDNCDDLVLIAQSGDISKPRMNTKDYVCPHQILAQPGQTVNIYLYDFFSKDSNTDTTPKCIIYGYISESSKAPIKICGGEFQKNHLIYSSDSNVVDITLAKKPSHSHQYLLHYEIVGCPTPQAPPNAFVKIEDKTAIVMCNFSQAASKLVCSGNEWIGNVENCTAEQNNNELLTAGYLFVTSFKDSFASFTILVCIGFVSSFLFMIGLLSLIRARCAQANYNSQQTQSHHFEEPEIPECEKSFLPVHHPQSVYVPITMDRRGQYTPVHQNNVFVVPRPATFSILPTSRRPVTEFATTLGSRIPVAQNIYDQGLQSLPARDSQSAIYEDICETRRSDHIIAMDVTAQK